MTEESPALPKPPWLRRPALNPEVRSRMVALLSGLSLHTVCQEADCPNIGECFRSGTATFLILGRVCTRNCRFCAVEHGTPSAVDPEEPQRVSDAALRLGLRHVVITSVTRDDLPDGGASQFADSVEAIRRQSRATVELLVPDMAGDHGALLTVVESAPEVLGHNVEVVPRLYPQFRSGADYGRSLALLARVKRLAPGMRTKSSLMVGVGETEEEVCATLRDLRAAECDLLTIGQYLRPSLHHAPVAEYVAPGVFDRYAALARELGFGGVLSGPFVRSSYCAASLLQGLPGSDSR